MEKHEDQHPCQTKVGPLTYYPSSVEGGDTVTYGMAGCQPSFRFKERPHLKGTLCKVVEWDTEVLFWPLTMHSSSIYTRIFTTHTSHASLGLFSGLPRLIFLFLSSFLHYCKTLETRKSRIKANIHRKPDGKAPWAEGMLSLS